MASISGRLSPTGQASAMPPQKPKHLLQSSASRVGAGPRAVFSRYLMNDIERGTSRAKIMNCLQPEFDPPDATSALKRPQVNSGCIISDSRLDDELSVAIIEFGDTPKWLQRLNNDKYGFPKKTTVGTLWKGVAIETGDIDELGRSEFIRAAIEGNVMYGEMLAEFEDTDVNVQDSQGRTALHWACVENHIDFVSFCLSILDCNIGLRDKDNLTAFDLSREDTKLLIPELFYKNIFEMDDTEPQTALLRMLTVTSQPAEDKEKFPGEAIFCPIEDNNKPLVKALIKRGVDLTAKDISGDTALHLAVKATDVEIAIRLMKAGSDVDAIGNGGSTPLHYAAHTSERRMMQALLSWDARPDTKNDKGEMAMDLATDPEMVRHEMDRKANDTEYLTPLHRATEDGDVEIVQLLLELGATVDERNSQGSDQTALMVAARMGHQQVGQLLVDAGANIEARDRHGSTPLDLASTKGFSSLLKDCGAKGNNNGNITEGTEELLSGGTDTESITALQPVAEDGVAEMMQLPLGLGDLSENNKQGTEVLLMTGQMDATNIKDILEAKDGVNDVGEDFSAATGIDVELPATAEKENLEVRSQPDSVHPQKYKNYSGLHHAVSTGDLAQVRVLLASGIDPDSKDIDGYTVLSWAAKNGYTKGVQVLLAGGAQTEAANKDGVIPLHFAAQNGHTDTVRTLLASGAQTEAVTVGGVTPMHLGAQNGHLEVFKALLASGAQTEAAAVGGVTPLHLAVQNGHLAVVKELLATGAQTEGATVAGETPLHLAVQNGHLEVVKALLASGAQIDAANKEGTTSLLVAAQNGHLDIVKELLAGGAQSKAATVGGVTPLHFAAQNGHTDTVRTLLAGGAQTETAAVGGETPLHLAAHNGHLEVVKTLLASGAEVEGINKQGATPLHLGAQNGHLEVVKSLLAHGAQTEAAPVSGVTALHLGAQNGHLEVVKALLAAGAQTEAAAVGGETPQDLASHNIHLEVVKVLRERARREEEVRENELREQAHREEEVRRNELRERAHRVEEVRRNHHTEWARRKEEVRAEELRERARREEEVRANELTERAGSGDGRRWKLRDPSTWRRQK